MVRENKETRRESYERPSGEPEVALRPAARTRVVRVPGGFAFVEAGPYALPGRAANAGDGAMR